MERRQFLASPLAAVVEPEPKPDNKTISIPLEGITPELALHICNRFPSRELESIIATDAQHSYQYAFWNDKPFPLGEKAIAENSYHSYWYAKGILKSPFPQGEKVIATSPMCAFHYACQVLKGVFPLGERAIAKDAMHAFDYAQQVLKGRFPLGEKTIWSHGGLAPMYAVEFLNLSKKDAESVSCVGPNRFVQEAFASVLEE